MKTFLLISLLSVIAQAQVSFKSIPVCSFWTYQNGYYVCSGYPSQESIPDPYSLNGKISSLENRIQILENKIGQLEATIAKGKTNE